jgi:hypothetical protein
MDIEIAFGREGRSGARVIRMTSLKPADRGAVEMGFKDGNK